MLRFEYKVVPAPEKGQRAKGAKGTKERFAKALEVAMNKLGAEGWDYVRTDTLPCEERTGLTGKTTTFQNMLVFRRVLNQAAAAAVDANMAAPVATHVSPEPAPAQPHEAAPAPAAPAIAAAVPGLMPAPTAPVGAAVEPMASQSAEAPVATAPAPQPAESDAEKKAAAAAAAAALSAYRGDTPPAAGPSIGSAKGQGIATSSSEDGVAAE